MSLETMRIYCEGAIQSAMAANYAGIPVKFDNAPFKQPDTTWTAFCVLDGKSMALNIGTLKFDRHIGLVQFDVLVPAQTGTSQANQIATFAGNVFREKKVSLSDGAVVCFKTPSFRNFGAQGGFFRVVCTVTFWRDEPAA